MAISKLEEIRKSFPIGTEVNFDKETLVGYINPENENKRETYQFSHIDAYGKTKRGQVIGATYIQKGIYIPPPSPESISWPGDSYEPAYLEQKESVLVLLVKTFYRGANFIMVRPEDVMWAYYPKSATPVPLQATMGEKTRQRQSNEMKEVVKSLPRDKKGRFI